MNSTQNTAMSKGWAKSAYGKSLFALWLRQRQVDFTDTLLCLNKDTRGASAVEFAIVAPVFIMLVLGSLAWGLYLGTSHSVAQLTADAARASIAGISDQERESIARQHVLSNAANYPLVDPGKITVVAGPLAGDKTEFRVAVRYDASSLPIWSLTSIVPLPSQTLERTSVVKRGGY